MFQKISAVVLTLSFAVALGNERWLMQVHSVGDAQVAVVLDDTTGPGPQGIAGAGGETPPVEAQFRIQDVWSAENRPMLFYSIAAIAVAILLVCIYYCRGFVTCTSILAYVGALSSMSMLIRNVYVNYDFKYPQFLTATHFVATTLVGSSILSYRCITKGEKINVPDRDLFLKGLFPVALAFVMSLGFANQGLLLTNAHFYEMVGSGTPLVTAGLAILLGRGFDMRLFPALGLITLSMLIIAFGEVKLSMLGLLALVGGVIGRAAKSTLQHSLMGGSEWKSMDPVEVAVWTSMVCFVLMAVWTTVSEGFTPMAAILEPGALVAVLYTCIGASILNIAALFVLRELGPVAQQIVGQMKGLLAILGSVAAFGETITLQQCLGYSVLLIGIFWYNKTDVAIKAEKSKAISKEADETTKIQKV